MYTILESFTMFENNELQTVAVLVDCTSGNSKPLSDVREIVASNKPANGYFFLMPGTELTQDLLQDVAAGGFQVATGTFFKSWKKRLQMQKEKFGIGLW